MPVARQASTIRRAAGSREASELEMATTSGPARWTWVASCAAGTEAPRNSTRQPWRASTSASSPRRQAVPLAVEAGDGDGVRAGGRGRRGVPRDGGDHALADVGRHVLLDDRPLPRGPALADLALRGGDDVEQHDLGIDAGVERVDGHRDRAGLVGDGDALEVGDAQGVGGGHAGAWIARRATSSWSCPSSHSTTVCSRCSHTTAAGAPAQAGRAAARRSSPKKSPGPRASTTPSL